MESFSRFQRVFGCLAATVLLGSCGIRLPDTPVPVHQGSLGAQVRQSDQLQKQPVSFKPGKEPEVLVWLIADDLHTGMVFSYDWLIESGFVPPKGFGTPKYVTLSWGDRTAYVEKGLHSPGKFFRALFTPTPSVMELIPANWNVVEVCPHQRVWRKLVPRENGRDLAAFLNDCSIRGSDGRPQVCGTSSWGGGVLLESRHVYFVPRMCNTWTSQAIESLGGKVNPWFSITANGLIRQAEKPPNSFEQIWWGGGLPPARADAAQ
jgi:hypothetical protein